MADFLEERGEPGDEATAAAIRWQVKRRKRPYPSLNMPQYLWNKEGSGHVGDGPNTRADIPASLWNRLDNWLGEAIGMRFYPSRRAAEEALWAAWKLWKGIEQGARS